MEHRCCWCGSEFVRIDAHYWCRTAACRKRQAEHSIAVQDRKTGQMKYLYLPLPRQVDFDSCIARFMLGGGAAGSTKSHEARWGLYRRCIRFHDYEALLLRRTWDELNKHHFRLMEKEARIFRDHGYDVTFSITNREMRFNFNGSVIEGGHMEDPEDVEKYLGREREEIVADEGSTFPPRELLALSTRARTSKTHILETGHEGLFRVYTNPGGPASTTLRDFFIDHEPEWDKFPPELKENYDPDQWVYIPGNLEDNPYLPPSYERDLMILSPVRFRQLRYNDWDTMAGIFFDEFSKQVHVKTPKEIGWTDEGLTQNLEWFRSLDWGYINPGCVLWWVCLPDGRYYIRKELKFDHTKISKVREKVFKIEEERGFPKIRYTEADPAVEGPDGDTGESVRETFTQNPYPMFLNLADNDRKLGWQRVREMLAPDEETGKPSLYIHPDCRYLIRSLSSAVSSKNDPEDIDTKSDDHALDTCRYGAMSRPSPTRSRIVRSTKTFRAKQELITRYRRSLRMR